MFDLIAFDADDTLWHNETFYRAAEERLIRLLANYGSAEQIRQAIHEYEISDLEWFGYGIKGFILSVIDAALAISGGRVTADEIQQIMDLGREMLRADIRLFDGVEETLRRLADTYPLMLLTKGDLLEQESRIARSGIAHYFRHIEIVSDKTPDRYTALLNRLHIAPQRFLMVGNSMRSDILPVLALGGHAVYVPYPLTWAHEAVSGPEAGTERYHEIEHIGLLPALLERLCS